MRMLGTGVPGERGVRRIRIEPSGGAAEWLELWAFRDLFAMLALRDIKLRYRQTALGILWVILQPLVSSLIFALIFGVLAKLPSDGTPYLLFVFAGILPWNLFSGGLQRAGNSLIADARLITKIYFPRAIIPLASTTSVLLDFAVASVVLAALMVFNHAPFSWQLLGLPVFIAIALAVTVGLSFFFSALNVYYRDFSYALPFIIQAWMYASPVVYSSSLIPERWQALYGLNPMVGVIGGFRWALLGGPLPALAIVEAALIATGMLLVGAWVFRRVERSFADVV
ncbi:MAG: ABC transporter permease [Chloroflexota bacterium]